MFQCVGSYELAVCFLVAPFNNDNRQSFRHVSEEVACEGNDDKRLILERSKEYVRPATGSAAQPAFHGELGPARIAWVDFPHGEK